MKFFISEEMTERIILMKKIDGLLISVWCILRPDLTPNLASEIVMGYIFLKYCK